MMINIIFELTLFFKVAVAVQIIQTYMDLLTYKQTTNRPQESVTTN